MASPILDMRAAIVERLRETLPGIDVEAHPASDIDTKDISRILTKRHLALRVAFAGTPMDARMAASEVNTATAWAVYILAKDGGDFKRDETILRVLPDVLRAIASNGFAVDFADQRPEKVRSHQVYRGEAESSVPSAMAWGVFWLQQICIPPDDSESDGIRPFAKLLVHYDLRPVIGIVGDYEAEDTVTLEQP